MKRYVVGSPLEGMARRLYIRLDRSPWSKYDRDALAIMKRCLHRDSNCIDIGAHRGTILAEILNHAPVGVHYAFEPIPQHYQYLAKRFPTVKVHQLALSDRKGVASFAHDVQHPTRSAFRRPPGVKAQLEMITVQTDRLDDIFPLSLPVHLIKLDVEGSEYQVLQGAVNTLRTHKPLLIFEHTFLAQQCYDVSPTMLYELLTQDCLLQISLMDQWLMQRAPLSRAAFEDEVMLARNIYFLAHP
jgi:FkbM family methyltransferase